MHLNDPARSLSGKARQRSVVSSITGQLAPPRPQKAWFLGVPTPRGLGFAERDDVGNALPDTLLEGVGRGRCCRANAGQLLVLKCWRSHSTARASPSNSFMGSDARFDPRMRLPTTRESVFGVTTAIAQTALPASGDA